ncbi:MAG: SCP2 sterol-binding domain-containing protein [Natrialbaceae archaeon]|nr:SCP2 sterol-binding domain-containing protein [Natrialbaceae archaeon]
MVWHCDYPADADEWVQEWRNNLNESEAYADAGEGWGVGFNGDFLFEIRPDDTYDGDSFYLFLELENGEAGEARLIDDPDSEDWGFAFRGDYSDWKSLYSGEINAVQGLMEGRFDLDGDQQKVMQYSSAAVIMTESASDIDTEFEY